MRTGAKALRRLARDATDGSTRAILDDMIGATKEVFVSPELRISRAAKRVPLALNGILLAAIAALLLASMLSGDSHPSGGTSRYLLISPSAEAAQTAPTSSGLALSRVQMLDGANGWALSNQGVLKTADGGETWKVVLSIDVGPTMSRELPPVDAAFLDGDRAWVASVPFEQPGSVKISRTMDGGAHWTNTEMKRSPKLPYPEIPLRGCALAILNDRIAWLMLVPDHGMSSEPGELYRTDDGGVSWLLVTSAYGPGTSLPHGGQIEFRDTKMGWLLGSETTTTPSIFHATDDGGVTWRQQNLPLPVGMAAVQTEIQGLPENPMPVGEALLVVTDLPRFFQSSPGQGVLEARFMAGTTEAPNYFSVIYRTFDGGRTWQPSEPIGPVFPVSKSSFITSEKGWVWIDEQRRLSKLAIPGKLYATDDGGKTWPIFTSNLPQMMAGREMQQLDFVDAESGWALTTPHLRAGQRLQSTELFRTTDGGKTWTFIASAYAGGG
jgi:photosystem II stability/assembly factor-like uncharacterized protein